MVRLLGEDYRVQDPPGGGGDVVAHLFRRRDGRGVLLAWTRGSQATTRRFDPGTRPRRLTLDSVAGFPVGPGPFAGSTVELRLAPGDVVIVTAE